MAGNGGGFTNNFISLKTLVERLQYGRDLLVRFWQGEIEAVRRAMGFRKAAHVHFDQMSLADESTEKNLLLQLADRDIISHETVLERFKEIPSVEKIRLKREVKERAKEETPNKAGPYHNPEHKQDLEKIGMQGGKLTPQDVGLETSVPDEVLMPEKKEDKPQPNNVRDNDDKTKDPEGGRPKFSVDTEPRKQRVETPKSKPGVAELIMWSNESFETVSTIITDAYLEMNNKSNLRQITKSEVHHLEKMKMDVLTNIELMSTVTKESVYAQLKGQCSCPKDFTDILTSKQITLSDMSINSYRSNAISAFVEYTLK
tara:strand:- start:226 stop:1170 length:945 start_codon:yes stop_codon:yes gene_type:complete